MKLLLWLGAFALVNASSSHAQQAQLGFGWGHNLAPYKSGRAVTGVCPPGGKAAPVWGSGPYTADSSVCTAAVHAGLITLADGGVVTATVGEGGKAFTGSTRNGITTLSESESPNTFSFAKERDGGELNWNTTARGLPTSFNTPLVLRCPPSGKITDVVYGTDSYTDDSPICVAAVHAGLIDLAKGGRVTVSLEKGLGSYPGSARNGVTTTTYGAWPASFRFSAAAVASSNSDRHVITTPPISVNEKPEMGRHVIRTPPIESTGKNPRAIVITTAPIIVQ